MKVSKEKAIKLINDITEEWTEILNSANLDNLYDERYDAVYKRTEMLLANLFSEDEIKKFRTNVSTSLIAATSQDRYERLKDYKKHLKKCINQLKAYKEQIELFENDTGEHKILTFVSMSFNEKDKDINRYVTDILKALKIKFITGERYSRESIPQKVENRIRSSGLFIIILVKRGKLESGKYAAPAWLIKELGIAKGANKEIIAWVEEGIEDIAGLNYEKEVIYFKRNSTKKLMQATIKFLEALKEHNLV